MRGELTKAECSQKIMDFSANDVGDTREEHIAGAISVTIPSCYLTPTFTYKSDQHDFHVNISYWILIEIHVRGVFNSLQTTIPLSIGFEPENITFEELSKPQHHQAISFCHHTNNTSVQQCHQ
jgi:hypothetical protein